MRMFKDAFAKSGLMILFFTLVCGGIYTLIVTGLAQLLFPYQANGSIIEIDGKKYGSVLMGQHYTDDAHLWGRIMKLDVSTYTDAEGKRLLYAAPSNLSPASKEFGRLVEERVRRLKKANPAKAAEPVPVDLVTSSGSGLDPHISVAAARYQIPRLAAAHNLSEAEVENIIAQCTEGRFLGVFGEKTVNVLKVNLMLDGILQ